MKYLFASSLMLFVILIVSDLVPEARAPHKAPVNKAMHLLFLSLHEHYMIAYTGCRLAHVELLCKVYPGHACTFSLGANTDMQSHPTLSCSIAACVLLRGDR